MSWFLNEINNAGAKVRLCMEDGRLLTGFAVGIDTSKNASGLLKFKCEDKVYLFRDVDIADYITV